MDLELDPSTNSNDLTCWLQPKSHPPKGKRTNTWAQVGVFLLGSRKKKITELHDVVVSDNGSAPRGFAWKSVKDIKARRRKSGGSGGYLGDGDVGSNRPGEDV